MQKVPVMPDFHLSEIHRQAEENPIIRMSMDIRRGKMPRLGKLGDSVVITHSDKIPTEVLVKASQILCGTNKFRKELNAEVRDFLGYENEFPRKNEKLICEVNNPPKMVFNGTTLETISDADLMNAVEGIFSLDFRTEDGTEQFGELFHAGIMNGTVEKNKITSRMRKDYIFADYGYAITVHKCIPTDTLITTENGIIEIGELDNGAKEGEFKSLNNSIKVHNGLEFEEVEAYYNNGLDELYQITSEFGYSLSATKDHKIIVFDTKEGKISTKLVHELDVKNDNLLIAANTNAFPDDLCKLDFIENSLGDIREQKFTMPEYLDTDLGLLLGLLTADGFIDNKRIHYTKNSLEHCELVRNLFTTLFKLPNGKVKITKSKNYDFYIATVNSCHIARFLNNFKGLTANNKHIDSLILKSPKAVQAAFLKGLFEDGYVNLKKDKFDHIELCMKEDKLFTQVQMMLLNFGIVSSKYIKHGKKYSKGYINCIFIYSYHAQKFYTEIGFIDNIKNSRCKLSFNIKNKYGMKGFNIGVLIDRLFTKFNLSKRLYDNSLVGTSRNITLNVIEKIITSYKDTQGITDDEDYIMLQHILNHTFYLQRIKSIKQIESKHTVCLRMKNTPIFTQNGIIAGNSQGSTYKNTVVFGDPIGRTRDDLIRWWYTAVTRSSDKLIIGL